MKKENTSKYLIVFECSIERFLIFDKILLLKQLYFKTHLIDFS